MNDDLRRGFDDLFGIFDRQHLAVLLKSWEGRWPEGATVRIVAECRRGADGTWGIEAVEISPAPEPSRADGGERIEVSAP